ncbi:MAG: HepT-like ribonuclease domain-containing protein, partial [Cyanobacteria bacterium P01_E01_bin.42]
YPQIPWRLMGDMRNVMAHEYFQVALDRIWSTIQNDLEPLILELQIVLAREGEI